MTEINMKDLDEKPVNTLSIKKVRGRKPNITMNEKPTREVVKQIKQEDVPFGYTFYGIVPQEIATGGKGFIMKGLSIPAGDKAPIFHQKLKSSNYLNAYMDKYMYVDYIATMNDHVKAIIATGFLYIEASLSEQ